VKYDKAVLEACRGFAARDGAVDLAAAKSTWALIADGAVKKQTRADGRVVKSSVTNVELATALYALETFAWADDAQAWFQERVEGVDAK
jgi:5-hydroxyisourate hydrolase-like protein (transthyretin family)